MMPSKMQRLLIVLGQMVQLAKILLIHLKDSLIIEHGKQLNLCTDTMEFVGNTSESGEADSMIKKMIS